jgi:hypothetical protein
MLQGKTNEIIEAKFHSLLTMALDRGEGAILHSSSFTPGKPVYFGCASSPTCHVSWHSVMLWTWIWEISSLMRSWDTAYPEHIHDFAQSCQFWPQLSHGHLF